MAIILPVGAGTSVGSGLVTYSGLLTSAGNWLNRADLTTKIPDFIVMLEARLNRILRATEMEDETTITIDAASEALPTDFLEVRSFYIDADINSELEPVALGMIRRTYTDATTGRPEVYAITDGAFQFGPAPDASYSGVLAYYKKIPAISSDSETNWLITSHPDIYLYGTLVQAEAYLWNDERVSLWKSAFDEAIGELMAQGIKKRHGGGPLRATTNVRDSLR